MRPRILLNFLLLALAVVLTILAVYEPGKAPPAPVPALTTLLPDRVQRLRIERRDAPTVLLERDESGWELREPVEAAANPNRVDSVLRLLEAKTSARFPVQGTEPARYGLADPGVRLIVNEGTTITFGDAAPLDQRRYVQVGEEIATVNDAYYYHLIGDAGGYASEHLLPAGARVSGLELPGIRVQRDEQGHWEVEPPPENASADAVAELVNNWELARAFEVRLAPEQSEGEPVTVHLSGRETPVRFLLSESGGDSLLVRPELGLAYRLTQFAAQGLFRLPEPPAGTAAPDS